MLFAEVVAASAAVAAIRSRTAKTAILAELLARAGDGIETVTAWLSGEPRQGRIGIGWRRLGCRQQTPPAAEATLTVDDVDRALDGAGRHERCRLVEPEGGPARGAAVRCHRGRAAFLVRLFTGEMRQGALEAVVLDASSSRPGSRRRWRGGRSCCPAACR